MIFNKYVFILIFFIAIPLWADLPADSLFPTPEILKDKVTFWKKVYAELSLHDGMIHDRDYPLVIYKTIKGEISSPTIKKYKDEIISSLSNINSKPESLWTNDEKAIVELFRQHANIDALKDASERIRFQQGQADRYREGLIRSGQYLDTIRSILKEHGIPERLAYLPHVESSFNTAAYSKVGAAGLWQFMRGTGKLFGMRIDYTIDERRDPIIATKGAARYLSSAYSDLKTWPLAITSYNHGVNGMKRAVSMTGSRDIGYIIQNYTSNSFGFASSNFYSCFLAASEIAMNYKSYFPDLTQRTRLDFSDYTLDHFVSPQILCKYLNISKDQLVMLNPAIRPAIFEQSKKLPKGFKIHIPSTIPLTVVTNAMSTIPDSLKSNKPDRPQYYKVNKGDNLVSIASRLNVSINDLVNENNLNKKNRLVSGQLLRVPLEKLIAETTATVALAAPVQTDINNTNEIRTGDSVKQPSNAKPLEIAQSKVTVKQPSIDLPKPPVKTEPIKQTIVNTPPKPPVVPMPAPIIKTTAPLLKEPVADSIKEIASIPAVESKDQKTNDKSSISGNFDISIYNLDVALSPTGTSAEITVSIEETLGHYAEWLGIPATRIRRLNNMGSGSDIRINKKLEIPIDRKDIMDQFVEARLEYHMAIEEDFYSQYKVSEIKPHTIMKNENLWDICNESDNENGLPLWLFKKYNKQLDLNRLVPGATVWIPVISEKGENDIQTESNPVPVNYTPFIQPRKSEQKGISITP